MFFGSAAVDAYIIMDGNNAREKVCYLVHAHLKDILGHLQAKRHAQEPIPDTMCVEGGQVGGFLIEVDAPEPILSVQLTETCSPIEPMRNFLKGWGLLVLSNCGLLQVLRIKAHT